MQYFGLKLSRYPQFIYYWTTEKRKLLSFKMQWPRSIFQITRLQRMQDITIRTLAGVNKNIGEITKEKRLKWFGHLWFINNFTSQIKSSKSSSVHCIFLNLRKIVLDIWICYNFFVKFITNRAKLFNATRKV